VKAILGLVILVGGSVAAHAGAIDLTTLTLNGSATLASSNLQLTNTFAQVGSAYIPSPLLFDPSTGFTSSFQWTASNLSGLQPGGDGFAFVIQNDPNGSHALGNAGGDLGFDGITGPALAVGFDIFGNFCGAALQICFSRPDGSTSGNVAANPSLGNFQGDPVTRFGWVDYDANATLLSVFYSSTAEKPLVPITSLTVSLSQLLNGQAFFGFSGATGGATVTTDIQAFELNTSTTNAPEPGSMLMLAGGLAMLAALGLRAIRRSN